MFCPNCGKQINDDDVFCAYCGETIGAGSPDPMAGSAPVPVQQLQYTGTDQPASPQADLSAPQQPYAFTQPQTVKKKNGGMIAVIIALSVLLAAAVGGIIFLILRDDSDDSSGDRSSRSDNAFVTSDSTEPETTTVTEEVTTETETTVLTTSTTEETTSSTTETTTTTAETTTIPVTTEQPSPISDDAAAKSEASAYSTRNRPTFDEFDWCYGQNGLVNAPPPDSQPIDNYYATGGGWKSMLIYEDTEGTGSTREIDNIEIFFDGNRVTLAVDWYYVEPAYSEAYYMDDGTITQFSGSVNGNTIHTAADINGEKVTIDLYYFWRSNGKQYALGTLYLPDGSANYLALVRK